MEGEVLESYVTKREGEISLKVHEESRRYGSPNEIVTDKRRSYGAAARELGCSRKQVTKQWANNRVEVTFTFRRREGPCFDLDRYAVYRSSPRSMPRFTIYSTH